MPDARRRIKIATIITRMEAGAAGVALRGALALPRDDFEVTVIAGSASDTRDPTTQSENVMTGGDAIKDAHEADLLARAFEAGLPVARINALVREINPLRDRQALRALTSYLGDGRFDVVHTHCAKAGVLGRIAAARAGIPRVVHTFHGFPFHDFQPAWQRAAYVEIERRIGRRTDAFLAVGSSVAAAAIRLGIASPERVHTIMPAIDEDRVRHGPAACVQARRRLDLPAGVRVMGMVGRIDYQKAPEDWVDALASIPANDVWGLWIGDGPHRERMLARARHRRVSDRIVLLGHRDDVRELLPAMDVFAMASRYEGLPCAVAEAMEAGVPVVATAVNSLPDIVVPGETGLLVPAGKPRLLGRAVMHVLDNPDDGLRMAMNARSHIAGRFAPTALGGVLDRVYRGRALRI
jgi:glycosyltransferase involved in cell wall biosynthesis